MGKMLVVQICLTQTIVFIAKLLCYIKLCFDLS